jgi:hypothetical protein
MPKMQTLKQPTPAPPTRPAPHRRTRARYTQDDERVLVEHDLISQADLDALRRSAAATSHGPIDLLIRRGVYTGRQIHRCLETDAWLKRSTADHIAQITSAQSLSAYQHDFARRGHFMIRHFLPREQLYALDLALHRMALAHVDQNPARHRLYHSLGGSLLYSQKAMTELNGHPALLKIANAFLGDDLVQGKYYVKVDDPYQFKGMFGHTHAETHYDCLTRSLYMFLYMDATGDDFGAFQIIPDSHAWYTRGSDGRTHYNGRVLEAQSAHTNKASLVHDQERSHRWAGYESLEMPGNTLLVLSPFLWHAVRPVMHRRRLIFTGFFDASALTRDFVLTSDYFGAFPYDLRDCDLSLLDAQQKKLLAIHLDRQAWLKHRGL